MAGPKKVKDIIAGFLILSLLAGTAVAVPPKKKPAIIFSKSATGRVVAKEFSCKEDTVYASLTLPKKIYGKHSFWIYWRRPDGKIENASKLYIPPRTPGQSTFPAYLQFHVPEPDIVDLFVASGVVPGEEFSGLWSVEAILDGSPVLKGSFKVICP